MPELVIEHIDESYVRLHTTTSVLEELKDTFSFYVPNYKFHPKYKAGFWDGRISLINWKDKTILKGLLPDVAEFCQNRQYELTIDPDVISNVSEFTINESQVLDFYKRIGGPYVPHESQILGFQHCVNNGRSIILAPTSNGKSYTIHGLCAFYAKQKKRVLIVIDRSQLVEQLRENIRDEYLGGQLMNIHTVYDKHPIEDTDIHITTWQSCYENDAKWFRQFDVLMADEVHKFKADSLKTLIAKCGHISVRHGFTATLDNDSKCDRLMLIGMFGTPLRVSTTKKDIEAGISAKPTVYAIVLKYKPEDIRRIYREFGEKVDGKYYKLDFNNEVKYLENNYERNHFIAELEKRLKGNTLITFKREEHGLNILNEVQKNKPQAYFANGTVAIKKRLEISKLIDQMKDATAVVSLGTFSTGISIRNINNIINACQIKSKITVPQLIGRGLRISETKSTVDVYDLGDDLSVNGKANATYRHFQERLQMYAEEGFDIKIIERKVELSWK